jgi:hypothetical protein
MGGPAVTAAAQSDDRPKRGGRECQRAVRGLLLRVGARRSDNRRVDDDLLASLVETDLRRNLEERAPNVRDVYGVCLWTDDWNGDFLVSLATESSFRHQQQLPAYASTPDEVLSGPAGIRWSVGDWHQFPDDVFLTDETKAALEPLASRMRDTLDEAVLEAHAARWREIAFAALELAQPLDVLPRTDSAIAFVTFNESTIVEQAEAMLRTIPASRFHATFPAWRCLAQMLEQVRSDEAQTARHRKQVTETNDESSPQSDDDELTSQLRACGLSWYNVESDSDSLRRALSLAQQK